MSKLTVDPELLPILSVFKELWGDTAMDLSDLAAARQTHDAMSEQKNSLADVVEGVETSRQVVNDIELGLDVLVYVHKPVQASTVESKSSALLHIHGGGFVTGSAAHAEPQLRAMAKQFNCTIVSVDYRLAPEHPFPAGLFDCFAALKWVHNQASALNIDREKIVVLGESAGGGLAAGLALYARDHSEIKIAEQILLYPMLDYRNVDLVDEQHSDTFIWSRKNNEFGWASYISDDVDDKMLAYASPSYAQDWSELPSTYVCVGDIDLFHKESCDYVERLKAAGVSAQIDVYPGAYHAFQVVFEQAAVSQKCLQQIDAVLSKALA